MTRILALDTSTWREGISLLEWHGGDEPPESVAEAVWSAYHGDRLHWYVPHGIVWLDRIKALAPRFLRNRFSANVRKLSRSRDSS